MCKKFILFIMQKILAFPQYAKSLTLFNVQKSGFAPNKTAYAKSTIKIKCFICAKNMAEPENLAYVKIANCTLFLAHAKQLYLLQKLHMQNSRSASPNCICKIDNTICNFYTCKIDNIICKNYICNSGRRNDICTHAIKSTICICNSERRFASFTHAKSVKHFI